MAGIAAHSTDDIGGKILLLGTVVLAVTDLAAVLTCLVLIVTQGTVQCGKLSKLISLELILTLRDRGGLGQLH